MEANKIYRISLIFIFCLLISQVRAQMPGAIKITPENGTGYQEIKLTFYPAFSCVPEGKPGLAGLDSIAMHSSAHLLNEPLLNWGHLVPYDGTGFDGRIPHLYPDSDSSYSITFNPSVFYGTQEAIISGINAVFNDGFGWEKESKDIGPDGCKDFYIPLSNETSEVTFKVNMSHQIFLGNFDPVFDFVDVAGNFNEWGNMTGGIMSDASDGKIDSIYSVTIPGITTGRKIEYKFRINKNWGISELPGLDNRIYPVIPGINILSHWYDDAQPVLKKVTFLVNMNFLWEKNEFDPTQDSVDVAGTFNNWGNLKTSWLSDPDGDGIYSITIDSLYLGQHLEYKFRLDATWGRNEFPGLGYNRMFTIGRDTNVILQWWNNEDPARIPGLFFSEYLDGTGNNNALAIKNKSREPINMSEYGIIYTSNGSDWSTPVSLSGTLTGMRVYLITNSGFDFSKLNSLATVDTILNQITSFDGNDAVALVKIFASGTRFRIVDQIGKPSENPGTGWPVSGIPDATSGKRLSRKAAVVRGQPDWDLSAGSNNNNSEWNVLLNEIPENLGRFNRIYNVANQWSTQNNEFPSNFKSVEFSNEGFGMVVGENGAAVKTLNYGKSWTPADLKTDNTLNDINIVSNNNIWIVGHGGTILHSKDGVEWENLSRPEGNAILSISFADSLYGFAVGEFTLLRTRTGGASWQRLFPEFMDFFTKTYFTDRNNGWVVGESMVLHTENRGSSWEKIPFAPDMHFRAVFFLNKMIGWLGGNDGIVMKTNDGGKNWNRQILQTDGMINEIHFANSEVGWAVGALGKVFMTRDGGENWVEWYSGTEEDLKDIFFVSRNKGWIVGNNGTILGTLDEWAEQEKRPGINLYSVFFTDEGNGWAVGDSGTILKTVDAGLNWIEVSKIHHAPSEPHFDIFFSDKLNGWIVTSGGFIYKTIDGGKTWEGVYTNTGEWYQSVFFLNKDTGWATAGGSLISRTIDGGNSWELIKVGTGKLFNDIYFVNSTTGWVVGQLGIILKSINGGLSWTSQFSGVPNFLHAVHFFDDLTGIAIGTNGTILRTTNGGTSWNLQESFSVAELRAIYFADNFTGWISGDNGTILHTSDGGISWNVLPKASNKNLEDIFFVDPENGWVVGSDGTILKTSSGGCQDPYVDLPIYEMICEGETAIFDAGTSAQSYTWNTESVDRSITTSQPGQYYVTVKNICKQQSSDSIILDVKEVPVLQFITNRNPIICKGSNLEIAVEIQNFSYNLNYTYLWHDSMAESSWIQVDTSGYFGVTVKDRNGCSQKDSMEVVVQYPWDEKISLVTCDPKVIRNQVVWQKTNDKGTNFYNIYKVQSTQKKYLGSVNANNLTVFTDTSSRPKQQSDRYVITTVDTCNNESFYSSSHKTMHLTSSLGTSGEVNLIWEHYEGIPVNWYYIFRGSDSTAMSLLDSVAYDFGKTQYTDQNVPNYKVYYQIGVKLPHPVFIQTDKKASAGPYVHSLSNLEDNRLTNTFIPQIKSLQERLRVYPNPTNGKLNLIISEGIKEPARISIYNAFGKLLMDAQLNPAESNYLIDIAELPAGLYLLEVSVNNQKGLIKVLKE